MSTTHPETPEPQSTAPGRSVGADEGLNTLITRARDKAKHEASYTIEAPHGDVRYEPGQPEATLYGLIADALATLTADRDRLVRDLAAAKAERDRLRRYCSNHRWNIDIDGNDLLVCMGFHEKGERCDRERYVPDTVLTAAKDRIAEIEAALKPFCFGDPTLENILFGDMPDEATCTFTIKLGDTRRARATLNNGAPNAQAR